jgi:hypothetical protein
MRRFIQCSFAFWFAISMTLAQVCTCIAQTSSTYSGSSYPDTASDSGADASGYTPVQSESQALTEYLKQRKLPLVGAQVLRGTDGQRKVVLYGFVGSDFGKADAVRKARRFLNDSTVAVDNRINVRPELLASNRSASGSLSNSDYGSPSAYASPSAPDSTNPEASSEADASQYPGPDSYKAQQANPYMQQLGSMMPLIALLGALGMGIAGGNSGFSLGSSPFGSSPFGSPSSSPFGPSSGPPYGSPYGGSPFGASPYGSSPYANSPYGSSPYGSAPYSAAPYPNP